MLGSNNEVAVLEAVLGSLVKSPAFALLEASHTETVPVASPKEEEQFATLMNPTENELSQMIPTPSEDKEFDRMFGALAGGSF